MTTLRCPRPLAMCCLVLLSVCGLMAEDVQPIGESTQVEPCRPWQADDPNGRPEEICLRVDDPNPQPTDESGELAAHEVCFLFLFVLESESHAVVQSSPSPSGCGLASPVP